jgi:hypothetical protein
LKFKTGDYMKKKFKLGDQRKIADLADITPQDLHQALNKSTSLEMGEKIKSAAQELGYNLPFRVHRVIVRFELDGE